MLSRPLGQTGRTVGALGLGTRWLGRAHPADEPAPRAAALRALCGAIDDGIDLIDASPAWGDAEALAGEAIRALRARDRVVLATSVPAAPVTGAGPARRGPPRLERLLPAGWVRTSIERSLRATRLDAIPLAWLGDEATPWDDRWLGASAWPELRGTMRRLVAEGKVLAWGLAAGPDVEHALAEPDLAAVQLALHLADRAAAGAIERARARDLAVVIRRPLAGGALAGGAATVDGPLAGRFAALLARLAAHVGRTPPGARATDEARRLLERAELTRGPADRLEADDAAELALRYVLGTPGVTAALVGTRAEAHRRAALAAADGRGLSPRLREAIEALAG